MTDRINKFISGETTLDEISVSELEGLIADFPYADTFKMLLAKKMNNGASHSLALQHNDIILPNSQPEGEKAPESDFEHPSEEQEIVDQSDEPLLMADEGANESEEIANESVEIEDLVDDQKYKTDEEDIESTSVLNEEEKDEQVMAEIVSTLNFPITTVNDDETFGTEDLYFESDDVKPKKRHKKSKKNKSDKFGLKEYSGISDFSKWLLSFKKDDVEKKIKKEEKAARKKIIEDNARKSVTKSSAIISEPLAEILASQGHLDDAKKMYEQLMHKYPEKSSYFAAKINNLIKI
jgi:hypothetical protein